MRVGFFIHLNLKQIMANKTYKVDIQFEILSIEVSAKNKTEARQKALKKINRKKPSSFIYRRWPDNKRDIGINEI